MFQRRIRKIAFVAIGLSQWMAGLMAAGVAGLVRADVEQVPIARRELLAIQENAWWIAPLLIFAVGILGLLAKRIGAPWIWNTIHQALNGLRDDVFRDHAKEPIDHHRATLYRYREWRWRFWKGFRTGWLVPAERSGHLTHRGIECWPAPDRSEDAKGVAGLAWSRRTWIITPDLPALQADSPPELVGQYAERTNVDPEWVREKLRAGRSLAGSYAALVVEVKGRPWGVIVLDSRSQQPITDEQLEAYKSFGKVLAPLLERV